MSTIIKSQREVAKARPGLIARASAAPKQPRRYAREPETQAITDLTIANPDSKRALLATHQTNLASSNVAMRPPRTPSRLDQLQALLEREEGAALAELIAATGWQPHSVRGAMAGALRKRGLIITSSKAEGVRRWRAVRASA